MQSGGWTPEHCAALRDYLARGMSYSKIAEELNARFGTAYTRSATIGRGKRWASPFRIIGKIGRSRCARRKPRA